MGRRMTRPVPTAAILTASNRQWSSMNRRGVRMDTAETRQSDDLSGIIARLEQAVPRIARDVAADLGTDVTAGAVEPVVRLFLAAIATGGVRVGEARSEEHTSELQS